MFYPVEKCGVTLHCLYSDSLTLNTLKIINLQQGFGQ